MAVWEPRWLELSGGADLLARSETDGWQTYKHVSAQAAQLAAECECGAPAFDGCHLVRRVKRDAARVVTAQRAAEDDGDTSEGSEDAEGLTEQLAELERVLLALATDRPDCEYSIGS